MVGTEAGAEGSTRGGGQLPPRPEVESPLLILGASSAFSESTFSSRKSLTDFLPQKELGKSRLRAQRTLHSYGVDLGSGGLGSHPCSAFFDQIATMKGLPRWLSGKELACQCRRRGKHRFNPW